MPPMRFYPKYYGMPWKVDQHQLILELRRFVTQNLYIFIITYYKWLAFKWSKYGKNMRSNLWKPPLHNPTVIVAEAKFYILNHVFLVRESFHMVVHFFGPILSKNAKRPSESKVASKNNADKTELQVKTLTTQRNMIITGLTPVLHAPQLGLLFIRYQTGTLWLLFGGGGRRGFGPQS